MMVDPIGTFARIAHRHRGAIVSVSLGPIKLIMPTTPHQVAHMYYDHWRKYPKGSSGGFYRPIRRIFGDSVVTLDGDDWLADRRLLQPIFSQKNLDNLTEEMIAIVKESLDALTPRAAQGSPLAINREMKTLAINVLTKCIFGVSLTKDENGNLGTLATEIFVLTLKRMFLFFLPDVLPLPSELALRRGLRKLDGALLEHLRRRRDEASPRKDLISLLLNARDEETGEPLTLRHIRDELVTFFFAGHETTAMALGWALYLLGRNPHVLEKLIAEIDTVLDGRTPTPELLKQLRYTRQVVQETLRFYPPAWIIPRICKEGDVIDGYAIPPDSVIAINCYAIHHDPALWERPESFEPERFEQSSSWPRGMYTPFGGGPRVCIGDRFSLLESQLVLAMFLQRFRPRLAFNKAVRMRGTGVALRPVQDIMMFCSPRS
jgi:cytochrome P450